MSKRIKNLFIDYEKGLVRINGKEPSKAVKVTIVEPDGWNIWKILNIKRRRDGLISLQISVLNADGD